LLNYKPANCKPEDASVEKKILWQLKHLSWILITAKGIRRSNVMLVYAYGLHEDYSHLWLVIRLLKSYNFN